MNSPAIDLAWQRLGTPDVLARPDSVLPAEPSTPVERTLRALARFDGGNFAGAAEDFAAVLALQPENPVASLHAALCAFRLGDRARALALLDGTALFPEHTFIARFLETFWPLRFEHAALRPSPGPAEKAAPLPREAAWAEWKADGATWSKAKVEGLASSLRADIRRLCAKDDYEPAWHLSLRALELQPGDEGAVAEHALLAINTGRYAEGRAAIERHVEDRMAAGRAAAAFEPPAPSTLSIWALAMHETGEHRGALAATSRIRPEGPEDFCAHFVAAVSWLMLGDRAAFRRTLAEGMAGHFLDTWELIVRPYMDRVRTWMKDQPAAVTAP